MGVGCVGLAFADLSFTSLKLIKWDLKLNISCTFTLHYSTLQYILPMSKSKSCTTCIINCHIAINIGIRVFLTALLYVRTGTQFVLKRTHQNMLMSISLPEKNVERG